MLMLVIPTAINYVLWWTPVLSSFLVGTQFEPNLLGLGVLSAFYYYVLLVVPILAILYVRKFSKKKETVALFGLVILIVYLALGHLVKLVGVCFGL
jgi:hypothetical protein